MMRHARPILVVQVPCPHRQAGLVLTKYTRYQICTERRLMQRSKIHWVAGALHNHDVPPHKTMSRRDGISREDRPKARQ